MRRHFCADAIIMSGYPPPQYGGSYGPPDQSNLPYLPPTYPQQYYPQNNQHGGHGQVNANSNYNAYGYNQVIPPFNPIPTPGMPPMPLFQGWNQDHVPTPSFSGAPSQSPYNGYTPVQEHHGPHYSSADHANWQQPYHNAAPPYEQQDGYEGEYHNSVAMNDAPAQVVTAGRRSHSSSNGQYRPLANGQQSSTRETPAQPSPSSGTSDFHIFKSFNS